MNNFENTELIQWGEQKVEKTVLLGKGVDYANPPTEFTLRGVRYRFLGVDRIRRGGSKDGESQLLAQRMDVTNAPTVWVSESFDGEIPFEGF